MTCLLNTARFLEKWWFIHSTEYAALHLVDYLNYEMDSRRTPVTIHLDLSKAFDCLSHSIFLDKLRFYGINEMAYKLMKNYLKNRKQFVQFDFYSSKMKSIEKGVSHRAQF